MLICTNTKIRVVKLITILFHILCILIDRITMNKRSIKGNIFHDSVQSSIQSREEGLRIIKERYYYLCTRDMIFFLSRSIIN